MKAFKTVSTLGGKLIGMALGISLAMIVMGFPLQAKATPCSKGYCQCSNMGELEYTGGVCHVARKDFCDDGGDTTFCGLYCSEQTGHPTCATGTRVEPGLPP